MSIQLPRGATCLLIGPNGAGKTTLLKARRPPVVLSLRLQGPASGRWLCSNLLTRAAAAMQVLGGKHMVPESAVRVLGEPPFHATYLTSSGALSYVGGNWERDIAFAGYSIPLAVSGCKPERTAVHGALHGLGQALARASWPASAACRACAPPDRPS